MHRHSISCVNYKVLEFDNHSLDSKVESPALFKTPAISMVTILKEDNNNNNNNNNNKTNDKYN